MGNCIIAIWPWPRGNTGSTSMDGRGDFRLQTVVGSKLVIAPELDKLDLSL